MTTGDQVFSRGQKTEFASAREWRSVFMDRLFDLRTGVMRFIRSPGRQTVSPRMTGTCNRHVDKDRDEMAHTYDTQFSTDTIEVSTWEEQPRKLNRSPQAIEAAVRRIVHDYVDGWGIVCSQTTIEKRRKKRIKNRRSHERQIFNRPVLVHSAEWAWGSFVGRPLLNVKPGDDSSEGGMYLVHDLSNAGMGLVSDRPPQTRLIVLEFDSWQGRPIEIVLYLRWRRRVASQDYRCGGSILGVLMPR